MEPQKKSGGLREVTGEITREIGWDNKIVSTLSLLTTRPGLLIREYCEGQKQKYVSPVVYFFGVTALETYLASVSGLYDALLETNTASMREQLSDPAIAKSGVDAAAILDQYNNVFSFLFSETGQKIIVMPVILLMTWVFYQRFTRGFRETSWFALYTLSHVTLLTLPFMLLWYFTKDTTTYTVIGLLAASVYWIWSSKQFFNLDWTRAIVLRVALLITVLLLMAMIPMVTVVVLAVL